jgi:hypothetical protein
MKRPVIVALAAGYVPAVICMSAIRTLYGLPLGLTLIATLVLGAALTLGAATLFASTELARRRGGGQSHETGPQLDEAPRSVGPPRGTPSNDRKNLG